MRFRPSQGGRIIAIVENVAAALDSGAILTTNMLKGGTYTDLLATYPATRVIQSDISDQLIPKLKKR